MSEGKAQVKAPERLAEGTSPLARALQSAAHETGQVPAGARQRVLRQLEGGQVAPARRRAITWALSLGGAAAAAAAVLVAVRPAQPVAQLAESTCQVQLAGTGRSLSAGAPLLDGASVVVQGGPAVLQLGQARAALASGSSAGVGRAALSLHEGAMAVSVRSSRTLVAAGPYRIEAQDAVFIVRAQARRVEVLVQQGAVRVRGSGGEVPLAEGASWASEGEASATSEGDRALARSAQGLPPLRAEAAPIAPAPDASRPSPLATRESPPVTEPAAPQAPVRKRRLIARAPAAPPPAPPAPPAALEEDDEALHARARALERQGQYAEAASLYAQLGSREGPHAESALYELARVQARFLEQPAAALAAIDEHRRRFPNGALAQEAALTAVELRLSLGGPSEPALHEMDAFLARFGQGERAPEVRWLRASLLVERGDCGRARPDLLSLAAAGPRAEPAVFALASCARAAGELDEARARLEEYLRRFPQGRRRAEAEDALRGQERP
jgi:ferric-dicitrate binding protein FerR (iron transport regulator)/outer membrane protein assembly factor BamD (BamD/ComL family)